MSQQRQEHNTSESGTPSKWGGTCNTNKMRRSYTFEEDNMILDYVRENGGTAFLAGSHFWKSFAEANLLQGRSWHSLRERYQKLQRKKGKSSNQRKTSTFSEDENPAGKVRWVPWSGLAAEKIMSMDYSESNSNSSHTLEAEASVHPQRSHDSSHGESLLPVSLESSSIGKEDLSLSPLRKETQAKVQPQSSVPCVGSGQVTSDDSDAWSEDGINWRGPVYRICSKQRKPLCLTSKSREPVKENELSTEKEVDVSSHKMSAEMSEEPGCQEFVHGQRLVETITSSCNTHSSVEINVTGEEDSVIFGEGLSDLFSPRKNGKSKSEFESRQGIAHFPQCVALPEKLSFKSATSEESFRRGSLVRGEKLKDSDLPLDMFNTSKVLAKQQDKNKVRSVSVGVQTEPVKFKSEPSRKDASTSPIRELNDEEHVTQPNERTPQKVNEKKHVKPPIRQSPRKRNEVEEQVKKTGGSTSPKRSKLEVSIKRLTNEEIEKLTSKHKVLHRNEERNSKECWPVEASCSESKTIPIRGSASGDISDSCLSPEPPRMPDKRSNSSSPSKPPTLSVKKSGSSKVLYSPKPQIQSDIVTRSNSHSMFPQLRSRTRKGQSSKDHLSMASLRKTP